MLTNSQTSKAPRMSRQHYEFLADTLGHVVSWPSHLHVIADELQKTNPRFDREKFIERATKVWEQNYEPSETYDEIPY